MNGLAPPPQVSVAGYLDAGTPRKRKHVMIHASNSLPKSGSSRELPPFNATSGSHISHTNGPQLNLHGQASGLFNGASDGDVGAKILQEWESVEWFDRIRIAFRMMVSGTSEFIEAGERSLW